MFLTETLMVDIQHNPSLISETRLCDLCGMKQDLIDMKPCLDGHGYYCQDCIDNGDVGSFLIRNSKADKKEILNYLNQIKA